MKHKLLFLISLLFLVQHAYSQEIPSAYTKLEESHSKNEFEACVELTEDVETFAVNRVDTIAANGLFYLADAYYHLNESDKAISYFEREKDLRAKLGDEVYYSFSLFNLAKVYLEAGEYVKAGKIADECLAIEKKLHGEHSEQFASSAVNIADTYIQVDRLADAERLLNSVIKRQPKNTVTYGMLLSKLGDLYSYTGQFARSLKTLQHATDVLFTYAGEESAEYTGAAINLGVLYMMQGKYPEAEEIFDVALHVMDPSELGYASLQNNQAIVYQNLGQFERAEQLLLDIRRRDSVEIGTMHPDYAITLSNLGLLMGTAGKYAQGEKYLKQALEIQKQNNEGATVSYARKLNNLAKVYRLSGKPDQAIPHLVEASAIFKKVLTENSPEYATASFNLGNAYWAAGKGQNGIKYLKNSAAIRAKVLGKKHPKYAEAIQKIGEYQWQQRDIKDAHRSFGEVFENFYFQINVTFPGLTEEEKSRFYYSNIKDAFEKFNSFAVASASAEPGLMGDVYNYHINTKGAIMHATEKVRKAIQASNDTTLVNLFEAWHAQKELIARSYSQNEDAGTMDSLIEISHNMEKELTKRSSAFSAQFNRKKFTWQDVQKTLKPGEAAVEVLRYKEYSPDLAGSFSKNISYLFVVITSGAKTPAFLVLNKGADMETKFLKYYHNSIKYNIDDANTYKNFFQPLAELLKKEKITTCYLSPDGVYNQINVNSVYNPGSKKFLLDEFDFRLLTNSRELVEARDRSVSSATPVLIGFPKFNLEKSVEASVTPVKTTRNGNLTRGMRGLLRFMRGDEGITELPGTQKEIEEISKLFSNSPEVHLAQDATEEAAKKVNSPAYLHIATHGYFLEDETTTESRQYVTNPLLKAGLILAGAENFILDGQPVNESGDDGILTAYEAMNLRLDNTKLVVLSACETGLGEVKNGEGVYGLQRAFKLAGAQSIVMSLWSVDDEATQELMSTFYAELLKTGKQHESFRIAQQKIRDKYQKPFYWGAFIMVGI